MAKLRTSSLKVGRVIAEELKDIVTTYPIIADKGANFPFLTWRRIGWRGIDSKDRYNLQDTATLELVIAATSYKESLELAQAVMVRLNHRAQREYETATEEPIFLDDITLINATEEYADNAYVQVMTFEVKVGRCCC